MHKMWSDKLKCAVMKGYFCSNDRLSNAGLQRRPSPLGDAFPPVSDFPPISDKFPRLRETFSQFYLFPTNFPIFIRQNF